ncbi:AMP-binding protein [Actinomyces polynesiensis]|uniref:AMP-binding protein n=1 Tax=Actinomyces polynesiensis TaxID=1325934 RepID=UPI000939D1A5|nr:AMP-binding protein [Actinomyces polynesiensis]
MTLTERLRQGYAPGVAYTVPVGGERVTDLLEAVASRYPDRAALDFFSRSTSYAELVEQSRRGASALAAAGVHAGDRVALVMPNCPQHVVAIFATMYLGAVVVEHNPLAPTGELREEFSRHGARVVIAWENSIERLDFLGPSVRVFGMDLSRALPRASRTLLSLPVPAARRKRAELSAPTPPSVVSWDRAVSRARPWEGECPVDAEEPALLIHTGGTTGIPKAAILSHRNLCANVAQCVAWVPELHEGYEVFDSVLPLFHAFGFTVSFLAGIALGATVALFPKFDTALVLTSQRRLPCTFFLGVPPMFDRLLKAARELDVDLTSMRFTISGAMALQPDLARKWEAATKGFVIEGYGMTEASPILLGSPLSPTRRPSTLGLPFPSTEIRIVDPEDISRDVDEGDIGELIARGPQVFSGYWGRPDETAQALQDGWLRTGDLVRVKDDFVVMADRRKEMINSSGFNVYPSQVEDAVRSMPGVSDVAVVGVPAGSFGESVVAAIVLEAGASVTLEDVRTWAEKSLAHYALPRQIVVMSELPHSQIGKVMRRRVREELLAVPARVAELAGQAQVAVDQAQSAVSAAAADAKERLRDLRAQSERRGAGQEQSTPGGHDGGAAPEPGRTGAEGDGTAPED